MSDDGMCALCDCAMPRCRRSSQLQHRRWSLSTTSQVSSSVGPCRMRLTSSSACSLYLWPPRPLMPFAGTGRCCCSCCRSSVIQSSAVFHSPDLPASLRPFIVDMPTVAKIFTGQIKHWRDPEMIRLNPDTREYLPDANMSVRGPGS